MCMYSTLKDIYLSVGSNLRLLCFLHQSDFHLNVESNLRLLWFCITKLNDSTRFNSRHFFQPIRRSEIKTNRDLLAPVFPRFVLASCFEF